MSALCYVNKSDKKRTKQKNKLINTEDILVAARGGVGVWVKRVKEVKGANFSYKISTGL